jgi:colicin import membrane protein
MKATVRHSQSIDVEQVPFTSSLVLSIFLHSALVLWLIGSAWLLSRTQSYRLSSHTVFLGGDSPFVIDQLPGEGGGSGAPQEPKEPETGAAPSVEKFAPPVEKPTLPAPKPAVEKPIAALPPKPVVEQAVPPPPKPVVEKLVPPTPAPKPVVERALPAPPKPPPEAMTVAQKETKSTTPPPPTSTPTEVQQTVAKLRQRQAEQERVAQAAQQRVADLRAEQTEQQAAAQRVAALRARVSSGSEGGAADTGSGSGRPGGGRGTGTAGAGGVGTGGVAGIRLRSYEALIQEKVRNAWRKPPQSKGLEAVVFLAVDRAGRIEQLQFVKKSGNTLFDESLQRAIKQAEPLPPLPEGYPGRLFEADVVFRAPD